MYISLIEQAQSFIAKVLTPGSVALDATTGNGYDTTFLAECVGKNGRVLAFDVQPQALQNARSRLKELGLDERVSFILASHQQLQNHIPAPWRGKISAVMFNLGYLPGGDKSITTRPPSTLSALNQACQLLAPGGRISLIAYTGHPGGREEAEAIGEWLATRNSPQLAWQSIEPQGRQSPPRLFLIERL